MTDTDAPTDPHAAPAPHRETGHEQFLTALRNMLDDALRPVREGVATVAANTELAREAMHGMRASHEARISDLERRVTALEGRRE